MATDRFIPAKTAAGSKPGLDAYPKWLLSTLNVSNLDAHQTHYETVARELADSYRGSEFWQQVVSGLKEVDAQYLVDHKYPLIADFNPLIVIKPWRSFLEKTYRKNIANNSRFPDPPDDGWLIPDNWYSRIGDIIRTTIVVRYLDGVPLLLSFLSQASATTNLIFEAELEARVDGYYGAHFLCSKKCEIPNMDWQKYKIDARLEIQITTSIKEVIKRLLHSHYETRRIHTGPISIKELSWNYNSEEFIASYLGHILHYVEGMILDVRDRKRS